jgi:hypothetical protein
MLLQRCGNKFNESSVLMICELQQQLLEVLKTTETIEVKRNNFNYNY